ncbi:glycosyltransferase family 4 protein [Nocardiopsis sp. HNM0947]|uniref:Glycosyltransferase family 4 protein n=1 Tax=Nocardiopsis coralli TaxID=2772213 RepID=A0ABR9PA60_9ACTN|nr:glycosyltransferase family 4 protein [Nocardiopsis coralli]MBE3000729.1 glycosyltransferase family 4 protein [Nocardiopsis coralli]
MKITYLINDMYGIGGTVRTVANQAAALTARHEVEIVSIFRHREQPVLPVPPGVRLTWLVDTRDKEQVPVGEDGRPLHENDPRAGQPPEVFPVEDGRGDQHSKLTDDRLTEFLSTTDSDVVVGTRPGLNVAIARAAPDRIVKIGQEHLTFEQHKDSLRKVMARTYPSLDAFVTVTEADARTYSVRMPLPGVRLVAIPNSVPRPAFTADGANTRTIVSAGRLAPSKRHDLLVEAFAGVADEHPDWTLRIYGRGSQRGRLAKQVRQLGMQDRIWLMGPHPRVEEAWAQGAFAAVTSSEEPFGMTIVEAMRSGLPVVSTDCPHGPSSIIKDHQDGILVPNRSATGIAQGLAELMGNEPLRRRMAHAALSDSERFDPARVVRLHEQLFDELRLDKAQSGLIHLHATTIPQARGAADDVEDPDLYLPGDPVPGPATGAGGDIPRAPAPRTETPPACIVEATGDGLTTLTFNDPPDSVVLSVPGERHTHVPDEQGRVVIDPATEHLTARTWDVLRTDGERTSPVEDVQIHQYGYPLRPEETLDLALAVPTRSAKGRLQVHVRRASHHAEIEHVEVHDGLITLQGHGLGAPVPDPRARLAVRLRSSPKVLREFSAPVAASGKFTAVVDPAVVVRGRHGESERWELRLVLSDGTEYTVGRHLSGVVGYKRIIDYPSVEVCPNRAYGSRVQPYYTVNDRLALMTSPVPPTLRVEAANVRPRHRGKMQMDVLLDMVLPEGAECAVEVVRGEGAGQRFPLHEVPVRTVDASRLQGELKRLGLEGEIGEPRSWQLRFLVGPPGALDRVPARAVPGRTHRRWHHGGFVRSATVVPLDSGDVRVTVADVRMVAALRRRIH